MATLFFENLIVLYCNNSTTFSEGHEGAWYLGVIGNITKGALLETQMHHTK